MRRASRITWFIQFAIALVMLVPLLLGFIGKGSFQDVFGSSPGAGTSGLTRGHELLWSLGRSGWVGLGATVIAILIGVPAAWTLSRRKCSPLYLAVCALPLALAPSVAVSGWLHWMAPENVASAFKTTPPGAPGLGPLFSVPGVAFILGTCLWPIVALETWPAFARARGDAYSAALLVGSPMRAFFRVVLPMSTGAMASGALLVFLLAAGDFTVSSLLLVRTLPIEVHDYLSLNRTASAAWAALPLVLMTAAIAFVLTRIKYFAWSDEVRTRTSTSGVKGGWGWELVLYAGLLIGFVVPLAGCAAGAISGGQPLLKALAPGAPHLFDSLRLAAAAAILAVVLGAARAAIWPERTAEPLSGAALLLLVVPGSFLAAGLLTADLFRKDMLDALGRIGSGMNELIPSELLLASGYAIRFVYLPLRLTGEGLRSLDPALLETAELAGHGRLHRGLGVAVPMVWRYLLGAGALVFVLSLGELPVASKLAPPGVTPASVWLFGRQHMGYTEEVFSICVMLAVAAVVVLLLSGGAVRWLLAGRKPGVEGIQ